MELAEFLGIMVGDGHISNRIREDRNSERVYEMQIHGNIKDTEYYAGYVNDIIFKLFNTQFGIHFRLALNGVCLGKNSKAIHSFLKQNFKLPSKKDYVRIPKLIMQSSNYIKSAFLRDFFDTDGCFVVKYKPNAYPVVQAVSKSQRLIKEIREILAGLKINSCIFKEISFYKKRNKTYIKHCIFINGRKRVEKYMKQVGFSNQNKIEKYRKFMENEPRQTQKRSG